MLVLTGLYELGGVALLLQYFLKFMDGCIAKES